MKRRHWAIVCVVLAALATGLGFRLYQEQQAKEKIMIQAENNYQKTFHELTYYVDLLEETLGTSLAMQSREAVRPQLAEVWRLSALAHGSANALPLTLLPFNRTNEFLAHVGKFAYNSGVKAESGQPLSDQEHKTLEKLYDESMTIRDGLRDVQSKVMSERLRWMDVEWALRDNKQNKDNQVIDGMKKVDGQATAYTESFSPENPKNSLLEKKKLKPLEGNELNKSQAVRQLKEWIGRGDLKEKQVSRTGKGSNTDAFEVTLSSGSDRPPLYASVTKKGGHILWLINERPVGEAKMSLYEAAKEGERYLKHHGFAEMDVVKKNQFDRTAVLTYAPVKENVRIYPASVRLKVAMDNGEVVGFDQSEFLLSQCDGVSLKPAITERAAREKLNGDLNVQESGLAVFQNPLLDPVLCYEFLATKGDDTYRVLLNAENGNQEKIERIRN